MQPFSVLDLFKVGIGPSSSHTLGPMRAAGRFVDSLTQQNLLARVAHIRVNLYGSLALTGIGHSTDKAIILGLQGLDAATIEPDLAEQMFRATRVKSELFLAGHRLIPFNVSDSIRFMGDIFLPEHPNGMRFSALDVAGIEL
ncbi:serine dehydratase beta chain, partial [Reinekea sp.]|uniref:serine dehydratase beta chain n=1 Tax=Reinekea sp. TaxID=1970455 RepID=UPI00258095AF